MKLYGFPPSPNTWQVRAVANYLGVPLEFEVVDLAKGGSRTPAYLAINPTGRTPALVDGELNTCCVLIQPGSNPWMDVGWI